MAYIIYHMQTSRYVKHPNGWTPYLKNASKFTTEEKVRNFMENNFQHQYKGVSPTSVQILNTNDLTQEMQQTFNTDTLPHLTMETASEELNNMKIFVDTMLQTAHLFVALPKFYGDLMRTLDMETQDILHKIEFTNENVVNGYKRYKQLQDVRIRRRDAKDSLELASLVVSSGLLKSLKELSDGIKVIEEYKEKRAYTPRVLPELFDEDEQEPDVTTITTPIQTKQIQEVKPA